MPQTDAIIDEIHAIREAIANASGNDIEKIAEAARKREDDGGRPAVTLAPRPLTTVKTSAAL